jgi:hypothetical protein
MSRGRRRRVCFRRRRRERRRIFALSARQKKSKKATNKKTKNGKTDRQPHQDPQGRHSRVRAHRSTPRAHDTARRAVCVCVCLCVCVCVCVCLCVCVCMCVYVCVYGARLQLKRGATLIASRSIRGRARGGASGASTRTTAS